MKNFLIIYISFIFFSGCSFFKTSLDSTEIEEDYPEEEMEVSVMEESAPEETREGEESDDVVFVDEEDLSDEEIENVEELPEQGSEDINGFADSTLLEEDGTITEIQDESANQISPISQNPSSSGGSSFSDNAGKAKRKWIPLKKIRTNTYNKAGFLVNAVYIARSGETIQTISDKIFNLDHTQQLYAINPHRSVKVGDKIYYNSPRRPQDNSRILFYFEDVGASPEEHFVQAGENIRVVASHLLGHKDSWKEIWATNPDLSSKGILNQPISIKYWTQTAVQSGLPSSSPEEEMPPPSSAPEELVQQQNQPPTSPMDSEDNEQVSVVDEPPPPSDLEGASGVTSSMNEPLQQSFSFANLLKKDFFLVTLVIVALISLVFIPAILRRRKKKEYDFTSANLEVD